MRPTNQVTLHCRVLHWRTRPDFARYTNLCIQTLLSLNNGCCDLQEREGQHQVRLAIGNGLHGTAALDFKASRPGLRTGLFARGGPVPPSARPRSEASAADCGTGATPRRGGPEWGSRFSINQNL